MRQPCATLVIVPTSIMQATAWRSGPRRWRVLVSYTSEEQDIQGASQDVIVVLDRPHTGVHQLHTYHMLDRSAFVALLHVVLRAIVVVLKWNSRARPICTCRPFTRYQKLFHSSSDRHRKEAASALSHRRGQEYEYCSHQLRFCSRISVCCVSPYPDLHLAQCIQRVARPA